MTVKKEKNFVALNLQHFQFGQDGWKTFFHEDKLNINLD